MQVIDDVELEITNQRMLRNIFNLKMMDCFPIMKGKKLVILESIIKVLIPSRIYSLVGGLL